MFDDKQYFDIIAFPWGWDESHKVTGKPTKTSSIESTTITNSKGFKLFSKNIQVIPFDVTVYGGMSGAPVISNDKIIGVLSGSLDEGGSIAWAIPIKYVKDKMRLVNKLPRNISWPELTLMNNANWRSLKFEKIRPAKDFNVLFGLLCNENGDEYTAHLIFFFDDYPHNISYGFELGFLNYKVIDH